jgi:hypothetical protein
MESPNVRRRAFGLFPVAEDDGEVQTDRSAEPLGGGPSTIGVLSNGRRDQRVGQLQDGHGGSREHQDTLAIHSPHDRPRAEQAGIAGLARGE